MNSQAISLTSDPIPRLMWRIALPASVGMFFNTLFNVVDTLYAGRLGTDALAALSLSFPLFFLLIAVGSGMGQGATALISRALGAGDGESARHIYAQTLLVAMAVGLVFTLVGLATAPALFHLLGAVGAVHTSTLQYMNVILGGASFFIFALALNSGLAAGGETAPQRNFLILGFVANCFLNPLLMGGFIVIPAMGVAGIGLATVLVQIGGCLYLGRTVRVSDLGRSISSTHFRPDIQIIRQIAGQSIPATLNMVTIALGIFVMVGFVKNYGREAVAALGIATRIEQVILMPVIGLSTAILSLTGHNLGAGQPRRVREAWFVHLKHGVALMILGGFILYLFGGEAMSSFTSDQEVINIGREYLRVAAFTLAAYPILFVTVFMLQGMKKPLYGLWVGIYRQVAAPLVVFQILAITLAWGLPGIWWGFCLVTWSAALFTLIWGWRIVHHPPPPSLMPREVY